MGLQRDIHLIEEIKREMGEAADLENVELTAAQMSSIMGLAKEDCQAGMAEDIEWDSEEQAEKGVQVLAEAVRNMNRPRVRGE